MRASTFSSAAGVTALSEATVIPKVAKACGVMMDWPSTPLAAVMRAILTCCLCDVGSEGCG